MTNLVRWEWSCGSDVRSFLGRARHDTRNLHLALPSDPQSPITAVVSQRILCFVDDPPHPIRIGRLGLQAVALAAFEHLLTVYCGADLDTAVLIEPADLKFRDEGGASVSLGAVLIWDAGVFGAFARAEFPLTDDYWAERMLFLTELRHRAEPMED